MVTLKEALAMGTKALKAANIETPVVDAGVLLCHAAGCDRTWLYAHGEEVAGDAVIEEYESFLKKRAAGMPAQYITGRCGFMGLDFRVGPGILVPRPDTEILVETAVKMLRETKQPCAILDIGTGSGCIAVSMAYYLPDCTVTAVDISEDALGIAKRNASDNGVGSRVEFIRSDLFKQLNGRSFDAILSNPPYARSGDIPGLMREVRDFEPHEALDGGPDGLDFYRRIIGESPEHLNGRGLLAFEVGMGQAAGVAALMDRDFDVPGIFKDLAGIDRVVASTLK